MAMKWRLGVALIFVILLGSGVFLLRSFIFGSLFGSEYEEPSHDVVLKDGNIEIRRYEPYVVAEITVAGSFDRATQRSFSPLFGYISGNNRNRRSLDMTTPVLVGPGGQAKAAPSHRVATEKMAMTIPVLVQPKSSDTIDGEQGLVGGEIESWTMAFVLPEGYTSATAPLPANSNVVVRQVARHEVASIRFNGRLSNKRAEEERARLETWLAARSIAHQGDWRIAAYDPPFTIPLFRRNEVLVTLQ